MERTLGCIPHGKTADEKIEALRIIKDVGFTHYFIGVSNDKKDDAERIMNAARNIGLELDEVHCMWTRINHIWYDDPHGEVPTDMMLETLDFCAQHDVPIMVIHDSSGRTAPDMSNAGLARFRRIFEAGNEKGVKIAVENLRRTNNTARIFHENKDIPVYHCWDSGHENCYTPGVEHLALFPGKQVCTHIHDNRGIFTVDDHYLPFDGTIDWAKKAALLKAANYEGVLTLEVERRAAPYTDWSDEKCYREAFARISKIAEMCGR